MQFGAFALVRGHLGDPEECAREELNLPLNGREPESDKDYRAIPNGSEDVRGADVGQGSLRRIHCSTFGACSKLVRCRHLGQ